VMDDAVAVGMLVGVNDDQSRFGKVNGQLL
jgi:hypothetical protein